MKRIISLLTVLAFVVAFSGNAIAQTATVDASVVASLTKTILTSPNYGQISNSTSTDAILKLDGTAHQNVGASAAPGKIEVSGSGGAAINVDATLPTQLSSSTVSTTIAYTPKITHLKQDQISNSSEITSFPKTVNLSSGGLHYLYIGGTLSGTDISNASVASDYTADIQFTISYN